MTCLDAAARFAFLLELTLAKKTLAAIREQATAAFPTEIVVSTVIDREAAVVRARSEFTKVAAKPDDEVSSFVSMEQDFSTGIQMGESIAVPSTCRNFAYAWGKGILFPPVFGCQIITGVCCENKRFPVLCAGSEKTRADRLHSP